MLNKLALAATAAVAILGISNEAHAAPTFLTGPAEAGYTTCPLIGPGIGSMSSLGYYGEDNVSPNAGDVTYLRMTVLGGCLSSTNAISITIPTGATLATDVTPVTCKRKSQYGTYDFAQYGPAPYTGQCFQAPTLYQGAYVFGWSWLNENETLEVTVPVRFSQPFFGTVEGRVGNNFATVPPKVLMTVYKPASFANYAGTPDSSGFKANLSFAFYNYYRAGTLVIEYNTSMLSQGQSTPVPSGSLYYPNVTVSLDSLVPATTYFWRPRFEVPGVGTFYGTMQSFTTPPATIVTPNPNPAPPYNCRFVRCR